MTTTLPKSEGTYTFASQPRAVAPQRSKYREPAAEGPPLTYGNMMYDPRIVRGNTYRLQTTSAVKQPDPLELQTQQEKMRRTLAKKKAEDKMRTRTPDAVAGRAHTEVQTELYLEELSDRAPEQEVETQTDAFLDRPPSPLFVPVKSGVDAFTQIENGELFDFDIEVRPILEVLVGKTVEQALMEVMEEEELARLREHQREFDELRNAELVETQRREEAARRAREEKDRRVRQAREALAKEKETSEKVAARAFAKTYMANLVPSVFTSLSTAGYFFDEQEREIESEFIPWLLESVEERLKRQLLARDLLDGLLQSLVAQQSEAYAALNPPPPTPAAKAPRTPPASAESGAAGASEDGGAAAGPPALMEIKEEGEGVAVPAIVEEGADGGEGAVSRAGEAEAKAADVEGAAEEAAPQGGEESAGAEGAAAVAVAEGAEGAPEESASAPAAETPGGEGATEEGGEAAPQ